MELTLESYCKQRERLLAEIIAKLTADERFIAGWLTGSFGRNEEDHLSDLDLSIVVSDQHSESLCRKPAQVSAQTSPERFSLFSQFGTPALIHENNNNAPEDGTFTFVLYADSPIMVDWILFPYSKATRPKDSKLLFDKVGIPPSPLSQPETLEQRKKAVAEQWAFFWMMTAITTKSLFETMESSLQNGSNICIP